MKKSEMIKIIENAIHDGDGRQVDYQDPNYNEIAAYILEQVLKAGMLPPYMEFEMGGTIVKDVGWEDEDG